MRVCKTFVAQAEFSKEEFLRQVIIHLGTHKDTPVDVVHAQFGEVRESTREVLLCDVYVEGECHASIGYDRKEPYIDYESYSEKIGDRYVTRKRPVTKYKTVTDWHPWHANFSGDAVEAAYNTLNFSADLELNIVRALKTMNTAALQMGGEVVVNEAGVTTAAELCRTRVRAREISFPGNKHKDVSYNDKVVVKNVSCYRLPVYEVSYTYEGKEYLAAAFACGEITIAANYPPNDVDITEVVESKTHTLAKNEKKAWVFFTGAVILSVVLLFVKFVWLWPAAVVLLLLAKKSSDAYRVAYQTLSDTMSGDVMAAKLSALEDALKKHDFAPLNTSKDVSVETFSVPGAKALKDIKGRVIGCWILVAVLAIVSLVVGYNVHQEDLHSPKHVEVKVVEKTERYDPDAKGYINGCYYIDFDYEIESKKLGIDYIEMKIYVFDNNGKEIGWIRSSLSDLRIEKGEAKVIETYLSENQPEGNAFFTKLYNMDLKDMRFEVEIGSIRFSDGEYYHNEDYNQFG